MPKTRLYELTRVGQEVWFDDLYRSLITSGELQRMVEEDGLTGVTSNPTIFEKAITRSSDYDEDIVQLKKEGKSAEEITLSLMVKDVQMAADVLKPVYEESEGRKGYVSLEVSPLLAYDYEGTKEEVKRIFSLVNRENLMAKVPGTPQGIKAFKELTAQGYNINVTLLFSLNHYHQNALAYIEGISERYSRGLAVSGVASVASVFLSRIDKKVDKALDALYEEKGSSEAKALRGQAAISVAHLIYEDFLRLFEERFGSLQRAGARVQKPLWASSSTKDPSYSDVKYVEALIFPQTVITLPRVTVEAFRDHGEVRLTTLDPERANHVLSKLEEIGIDINKICDELQKAGVEAFEKSYLNLLKTVEERMQALS